MENAANRKDIVGIADQEWHTLDEMTEYKAQYPNLTFLPRRMIDNFFIDPDELRLLIREEQRDRMNYLNIAAQIETARPAWVLHGALSYTLQNRGAHDFCRGEEGFPKRLLIEPEPDHAVIRDTLANWHVQLEPNAIMDEYINTMATFNLEPTDLQYRTCIDGKRFFESVVHNLLNQASRQQDRNRWISILFEHSVPTFCPSDLQPLLQKLMS